MILAKNIHKFYDNNHILKGIDINVNKGEIISLVGASGAVFGLLMAFGLIFPNALLMFMFVPFPIKAKYFVLIYGLVELYLGFQNNSNVAHFAHLGGMLFGFMIIKYWQTRR